MAGTYNAFAAGYREIVFLKQETTYGTVAHPAATEAVIHQKGTFNYNQERVNRADKTSNRSTRERITHRKEVQWSLELYNLPSGTSGTAPDITDALEYAFGSKKTISDHTIDMGASTTSLPLTAGGTDYAAGDPVGWVNSSGDLEVSWVVSIMSNTLTISPAFSGAPANGGTIKGGVAYKLADVLGSLTITRILDNYQDVSVGCFINDVKFEFPGTAEGTVMVGGMGKTSYSSGTSALNGMVDDTTTSFVVTSGTGARFQANTRLLIESEVVLVTAVSSDTLTVTRAQAGTSGAAHATATAIGPYEPSRTLAGSPISGTIGSFIITGSSSARTAYKMQQASITMNNQGSLRNSEFGTDSASGFFVNKRTVNFTITLWLEKEQAKLYNNAKSFTSQEITIQLGKTAGSVCAAHFIRAEFNIPKIEAPDDSEVSVPFEGVALGSVATGNDELVVAYM